MNGLGEDLAVGGYLALPGLENSANEDVARFAKASNEIATAAIRWAILLFVLRWVSTLLLVPYWIGAGVYLTHTGMTGLPFCALLAVAFFLPALILVPRQGLQVLVLLTVLTGAVFGVVSLTSGSATASPPVPVHERGWTTVNGTSYAPQTQNACETAGFGWTWDGLNCNAAYGNAMPSEVG